MNEYLKLFLYGCFAGGFGLSSAYFFLSDILKDNLNLFGLAFFIGIMSYIILILNDERKGENADTKKSDM